MDDLYEARRACFLGKSPDLGLMQLLAGLSAADAAAFCLVSPETYRRWRRDRSPPLHAVLCPPGWSGLALTPGDITALPLRRLQVEALQSELRRLRGRYEGAERDSGTGPAVAQTPRAQGG